MARVKACSLKRMHHNYLIDSLFLRPSILKSLEEFLHELLPNEEEIHIDAETLNFAHAALAVQNSTVIYSRKVEYLYTLTNRAIEAMTSDGSNDRRSTSNTDDVEHMDVFYDIHEDPEFLLLDDIPADTNKDKEIRSSRLSLSSRMSISSRTSLSGNDISRDSIETTRFENFSGKAKASASVRELLRGSGSGDFFSSSRLGVDGTLCLTGAGAQQQDAAADDSSFHINDDFGGTSGAYDDADFPMQHGDELSDHDNDGDGFAFASDDDDDMVMTNQQERAPENRKQVSFAPATIFSEKKDDLWELVDAHAETLKPRPLRIGKTIKLPAGVNALPSECVTGSRTRRLAKRVDIMHDPDILPHRSLVTETFQATLAARKRKHIHLDDSDNGEDFDLILPLVPLKGFYFGKEFAYIAKASAKQKAAERRERRQELTINPATASDRPKNDVKAYVDDDDDDENGGGFDFSGGDYDDDDDKAYGGGNFGDDKPMESNTGLMSVDDAFGESSMHDIPGDSAETDNRTFEELCRSYIDNLKTYKEKFMNRSQLAMRVNEWQERIVPLLEAEKQRPAFDIMGYGREVIQLTEAEILRQKVSNKQNNEDGQRVDFREVVRHQPQHEICRMFLATLSLCCSGNVEVVDNVAEDGSGLTIKLVNAQIDTPMEQFIVPSAVEAEG